MQKLRMSYLKNACKHVDPSKWTDVDKAFVAADCKRDLPWLEAALKEVQF